MQKWQVCVELRAARTLGVSNCHFEGRSALQFTGMLLAYTAPAGKKQQNKAIEPLIQRGKRRIWNTVMKSRSTHTCAQRQTNNKHTGRSRRSGVLYAQKESNLGNINRKLGPEDPYSRHTAQYDRSSAVGIVGGKQCGFLCRPVGILLPAFLRRTVSNVDQPIMHTSFYMHIRPIHAV